MISYAQNQEDVVLSRLLTIVPVGRFIDVGAAHPIVHNVTYSLYLEGWRGVNVEPMASEAAMLRATRPDDQTMQVAVGAEPGRITLYEAPLENRGATTADLALVERYRREGQTFKAFDVEVTTLDSIFRSSGGEVHLLKIDVEGAEAAVLAGANLAVHRPWVLVIEATSPNSTTDSSEVWEPDVLSVGYTLVLFDGLNRFYVRDDLPQVARLLSVPANVFDDWRSVETVNLEAEIERLVEASRIALEASRIALEAASGHVRDSEERALGAEEYVGTVVRRAEIAEEYALSLQTELRRLTGVPDA